MTKVVFFRHDGIFYGFRETGHTGYGDEGYDILCASISSLTMFIINSINSVYEGELDYTIDEGATEIMVQSSSALPEFEDDEKKHHAISGLFMSYFLQIRDLAEDYYKYLEFDIIDKEYEKPSNTDL